MKTIIQAHQGFFKVFGDSSKEWPNRLFVDTVEVIAWIIEDGKEPVGITVDREVEEEESTNFLGFKCPNGWIVLKDIGVFKNIEDADRAMDKISF